MDRKWKKVICVLAAVATLTGCGSAKTGETTVNDYNVDGTYQMVVAAKEADSTVFAYHFQKKDMTFSETVEAGGISSDLETGTYEIDEAENRVHTVTDQGEKQDFVICGEYLIADGFFYEGEIPDGKSFDVTCVRKNDSGVTSSVQFTKDGNYTFEGSVKSTGTYKRDGEKIKMDSDDGNVLVDFLIYDGQISNSYFEKQK